MKRPKFNRKDECPVCLYQMDCASVISQRKEATPKPGDYSVCLRCGALNVFNEHLNLKIPDEDELAFLADDQRELIDRAKAIIAEQRAKGIWIK